jgi:hypothetical protein
MIRSTSFDIERPFGLRALSYCLSNGGCDGPNYLNSRVSQGASRLIEGGASSYEVIDQERSAKARWITSYNKGPLEIIPTLLVIQTALISHKARVLDWCSDGNARIFGNDLGYLFNKLAAAFSSCTFARRDWNQGIDPIFFQPLIKGMSHRVGD